MLSTDEKNVAETKFQKLGKAFPNELERIKFSAASGKEWLVYDEEGQAHQFELDSQGLLHESLAGRYAPMSRRYEPGKKIWIAESGKASRDVNLKKSALAHFPDRSEIAQFFLDSKKSEEALQEIHKAWQVALKDFPENSFVQLPPEPKVPELVADTLKRELELSLVNSGITPSQYSTPEAAYQDLWALRHDFFKLCERSGSAENLMKVVGDLYHYSARTDLNLLFERKPFESDQNFNDRCQDLKVEFSLSCLDQSFSAIEQKFSNEIAKTKTKLEAQEKTAQEALNDTLQMFLGKDGLYIQTVLEDASISRDLKALYLKKAMTEEWPVFFESLDALYCEDPSNIELISALKAINDFCFNHEISIKMFEDSGAKIKSQLDHFFGQQASINFQIRKELMVASKKYVQESIDFLLENSEEEKNDPVFLNAQKNLNWRKRSEYLHFNSDQKDFSKRQIELFERSVFAEIIKPFEDGNIEQVLRRCVAHPEIWLKFHVELSSEKRESFTGLLYQELKEAVLSGDPEGIKKLSQIVPSEISKRDLDMFRRLALATHEEVPNPLMLREEIFDTIFLERLSEMNFPLAWPLIFDLLERSNLSPDDLLPTSIDEEFAYRFSEYLMTLPSESLQIVFKKALQYGLRIDGRDGIILGGKRCGDNCFERMVKNSRWDEIIGLISLMKKNNIPNDILNHEGNGRFTLLHHAILARDQRVVSILIKAGVKLNVRSEGHDNPLDLALEMGDSKIVQELQTAGALPCSREGKYFITRLESEKFLSGLRSEQRTVDQVNHLFPMEAYSKKYGSKIAEKIRKTVDLILNGQNGLSSIWNGYQLKKRSKKALSKYHIASNDIADEMPLTEVSSVLVAMRDYKDIHPEALRTLIGLLKSNGALTLNEVDQQERTALGYLLVFFQEREQHTFKGEFKILTEAGAEFFPNFFPVKGYMSSQSWQDGVNLSDHLAHEFMNHHPEMDVLDEKKN